MQIGINCLQIDPSSVGGVNSYTLGLLEGFANVGNGHRFRLYVAPENEHLFEKLKARENITQIVVGDRLLPIKRRLCRAALLSGSPRICQLTSNALYRQACRQMDGETDILYTPTVVLQWFNSRKPTMLSMHDIQQVHHPEFFSWARRLSRRITYGLSARFASYLQANSEFTRQDLLTHFRELSPDRVEVIPSGVSIEQFAEAGAATDIDVRYDLPERFLFFPAQLWPHKNHLTVLRALKWIELNHGLKIPLILTGDRFGAAPRIFEFIAERSMEYVCHLGKIPVEDMVALYHRAAFMVTATLHESSSLPILEAAAAGTPILASRIPPIEELGQVLHLNLFNPLDAEQLARLILELWDDKKTARAQSETNRRQVALYSWDNAARKYLHFFERALSC